MSVNVQNFEAVNREVAAAGARLVAVTKQRSLADIHTLYDLGQRDFGENRAAELAEKAEQLPRDIRWHFIGHLQRNKAREVAPYVTLLHAGDSLRLLRELDKRAAALDRTFDVLLQFHVAREESKYGLDGAGGRELCRKLTEEPLHHLRLTGVMGMATNTDEEAIVDAEFRQLNDHFTALKAEFYADDPAFRELSMGMSGDYRTALRRGSTLVRVGSLLFA